MIAEEYAAHTSSRQVQIHQGILMRAGPDASLRVTAMK